MNRDSMQKLRLDRRLVSRRDWISRAELEREIEALPDVSHKATTLGEAADGERRSAEPGSAGEPRAAG